MRRQFDYSIGVAAVAAVCDSSLTGRHHSAHYWYRSKNSNKYCRRYCAAELRLSMMTTMTMLMTPMSVRLSTFAVRTALGGAGATGDVLFGHSRRLSASWWPVARCQDICNINRRLCQTNTIKLAEIRMRNRSDLYRLTIVR